MDINKFILHTTVFSVFSEAIYINYGIDLKIFYLILFVNFLIIAFYYKIKFSRNILIILGIISCLGLVSIIFGSGTYIRVFSQVSGIFFVSTFYFNFFKNQKMDIGSMYRLYCKYAYLICILGLIIFVFNLLIYREIVSIKSIMLEPAHFVTATLPACFYFFKKIDEKGGEFKFFVVFSAIILSFSSLGILGIMVGLLLLPKRIKLIQITLVSIIGVLSTYVLLAYVPSFDMRVKDTSSAFLNKDLESTNLSSYALISNLFVAFDSFKSNPIIGGGIGSHVLSHQKYIDEIPGSETFGDMINLNSQDANSLFVRVISELGLFGIWLIFFFVVTYYPRNYEENAVIISRSILIYFFAKLLREGHYFSPEMYFFVFLYAYNKYGNTMLNNRQHHLE